MSRSTALVLVAALLLPGLAEAADSAAKEAAPIARAATTPTSADCRASVPAPIPGEIVPLPLLMSCTASATCFDGTTRTCSSATGPCTGIDASCPGQQGYVQCGSTTLNCPPCPVVPPGESCVVGCRVNSDCKSVCTAAGDVAQCVTGCEPKPWIKRCICA